VCDWHPSSLWFLLPLLPELAHSVPFRPLWPPCPGPMAPSGPLTSADPLRHFSCPRLPANLDTHCCAFAPLLLPSVVAMHLLASAAPLCRPPTGPHRCPPYPTGGLFRSRVDDFHRGEPQVRKRWLTCGRCRRAIGFVSSGCLTGTVKLTVSILDSRRAPSSPTVSCIGRAVNLQL